MTGANRLIADLQDRPPAYLFLNMPRMVLLRHNLPDGSWHYDWMVEREPIAGEAAFTASDPDARVLLTFQLDEPLAGTVGRAHALPPQTARRLADHRRQYLEFEGELSGDRGRVTRVDKGQGRVVEESAARVVVEGWWGPDEHRVKWVCESLAGNGLEVEVRPWKVVTSV